jgi:hypothetical protein
MATIDNLDFDVYRLYAVRTKLIEEINQQYRLQEAGSIPPQTQLIDTFPKLNELDLLIGAVPVLTPWAYFFPPKLFRARRRASFTFSRIVPSLGTEEEQNRDEATLNSIETKTPEEAKEKEAISACFKQINKLNGWLSFIIGRVGQFLQG